MARPQPNGCRDAPEAGFLTVQFVAAVGLSLVMFTALVNLVAFQYGRGVVRAALDEGVRAGSRATASDLECLQRIRSTLSDLLGGAMGAGVRVDCRQDGEQVVASASATFRGWLPLVPDWRFGLLASARRERAP